jgi:hypothetical protein
MHKLALIAMFGALVQTATAQRMGSPHFGSPFGAANSGGTNSGLANSGLGHFSAQPMGAFSRSFPYAIPFFSDGLYSNAIYSPAYGVSPVIVVMQAPPAAEPERIPQPGEPLLIELQGDHYVRLTGNDAPGAQIFDREAAPEGRASAGTARPVAAREPLSTLLVFGDGHREEVSDYIITGGVLYADGDYYADRATNKKVELSALNLPETIASNRSRGIAFRLPRYANEVIVGP